MHDDRKVWRYASGIVVLFCALLACSFLALSAYAAESDSQTSEGALTSDIAEYTPEGTASDISGVGTDVAMYSSSGQLRVSVPTHIALALDPLGGPILTPDARTEPSVSAGTDENGNTVRKGSGYGIENLSDFAVGINSINMTREEDRFRYTYAKYNDPPFDWEGFTTPEGGLADLNLYIRIYKDYPYGDPDKYKPENIWFPIEDLPSNWGWDFCGGGGNELHWQDLSINGNSVVGPVQVVRSACRIDAASRADDGSVVPSVLGLQIIGFNSRLMDKLPEKAVLATDLLTLTYTIKPLS